MNRREQEREARVDWILDAALDLIVKEGLASLTTPRLARELGYTPAAFYRYFDSKEALLLALETRTAERYYGRVFAEYEARKKKLSPLAQIVLLTQIYVDSARAEPAQFKLVSTLVSGDRTWMKGPAADALQGRLFAQLAPVTELFTQAFGDHALRRMGALWASLHGVLSAAPLADKHRELVSLDELAEEIVRTMLRGWGARTSEIDAAFAAVRG